MNHIESEVAFANVGETRAHRSWQERGSVPIVFKDTVIDSREEV